MQKKKEDSNMHLLDDLMVILCDKNEELKKFMKLNETAVKQEIQKLKTKITEEI